MYIQKCAWPISLSGLFKTSVKNQRIVRITVLFVTFMNNMLMIPQKGIVSMLRFSNKNS